MMHVFGAFQIPCPTILPEILPIETAGSCAKRASELKFQLLDWRLLAMQVDIELLQGFVLSIIPFVALPLELSTKRLQGWRQPMLRSSNAKPGMA
jgi:hypothetical protein